MYAVLALLMQDLDHILTRARKGCQSQRNCAELLLLGDVSLLLWLQKSH